MTYTIDRYSSDKKFLDKGQLRVTFSGPVTHLLYKDEFILEEASDPYHPLTALEQLRLKLEEKHGSLLACMGCRKDTAYRATGHHGTYMMEEWPPLTIRVSLFGSTDAIHMLCTVAEHKTAYISWCNKVRNASQPDVSNNE